MSASDIQIGGGHYKHFAIQPARFCELNNLSKLESDVIYRMCRWREKGKYQDLLKAAHEIALIAEIHLGRKIHIGADDDIESSDRARQRP